jgi:carboxyl-terminal processing protease
MFRKNSLKISLIVVFALFMGMVTPKIFYAIDLTYQQLKVLIDVISIVKDHYVDDIDTQKLIYGAAEGVVRQLDDFSQFMDPDVNKRVASDTEGEFGGLGIRIISRDKYITVVTPLPGTPAYEAGVFPDDRIIQIEGKSTYEMPSEEAVKILRGRPGTKVKITIARKTEKAGKDEWSTKEFTLERSLIKPEAVEHRMLENKIGYIYIFEFTGHVAEDTLTALKDLEKHGMKALILDLRYNPGGLLTDAVDIASYFLSGKKMIVYTKGRKDEDNYEFKSNKHAPYEDLPMTVLVNGGSASASEIIAGAMQDNKRAKIIGTKTFGKASVQSIIPLSDGSGLRLTVAKYYTPSGRMIHRDKKGHGGISPDIEVKPTLEQEKNIIMQFDTIYTPGEEPKTRLKTEKPVGDPVVEEALDVLSKKIGAPYKRPEPKKTDKTKQKSKAKADK